MAYKSDSSDRETRNIANSRANSSSIRPLLTRAAITADIEVLISFLPLPESLCRHYGFHAFSTFSLSLSLFFPPFSTRQFHPSIASQP